jgi:hypothetical protein
MFPVWHIALTALITAGLSGGGTWLFASRKRSVVDALLVGIAAGLGILLWRLGANTPILNTDPIPGISPADVLSAPLAYVAVGMVAPLRGSGATERLSRAKALAALIALLVNIITI